MSVCVNIKTEKRIQPNEFIDELWKKGENIIVTSDEFPYLKFGILQESLRGIEVYEEDDGYEVRICSCSSVADHRLFAMAIKVLMDMTSSVAYTEDDEVVNDPYITYGDEWIEMNMESSWRSVSALVKYSGTAVVMYGMFLPFCVGPRLLSNFNISLYTPHDSEQDCYRKITKYLVLIQWGLSNAPNTESKLVLQAPDNPDKKPLEISFIPIKNNKISKFDYVSYAPLLAFVDLDTNDSVIIRFEDFGKSVGDDDHFAYFDEWQMRKCFGECGDGELTVEEIRRIMDTARRYVPDDIHYRPTYPGSGYDEKQKTFVLMWNPENSDITMDAHISSIQDIYDGEFKRRVHDWKDAKMGDRFYVVRVGDGNTGVVMTGVFGSQPYVSPKWEGKGRKWYYLELKPNMILNPETVPVLTTEDLKNVIPDFMWRGGYSGRLLNTEQAMSLEILFANYLKKVENMDDGVNLCITRKM